MRALLLFTCCLFSSTALASVGHVSKLSGTASVQRGQDSQPLALGTTIDMGDAIATTKGSVVEITFDDDSRFTVGSQSRIAIDEFVYDASGQNNRSHINILKGTFRFASGKIAKQNRKSVQYKTPVATIGIRGSRAFGEVKANGHTLLGMDECCIDVASASGEVALDTVNTFSQVGNAYALPSLPAQCDAAWLNKTAESLGATENDGIYAEANSFEEALRMGQVHLNLRARSEFVDDDAFTKNASAHTLRTAVDYKTARFHGMSGFVELESTARLDDDRYNDTLNGQTRRPVIADSESLELNQLYLAYEGLFQTHAAIGRQMITYDNQRFVGAGSFRQDAQSFDAITLHDMHLNDLDVQYAYLTKIHNGLPDNDSSGRIDSDSHLINAAYRGFELGTLTAYGYLLDLEDMPALSSQSYGLRLVGSQQVQSDFSVGYALEYAHQSDYASNPSSYNASYYHVNLLAQMAGFEFGGGYEHIGSDNGRASFQFPIATKHAFNGDADKFTTTPAAGLIDAYVQAGYVLSGDSALRGMKFSAAYHDYSAEDGGADYGHEVDAGVSLPFLTHYTADLRAAHYDAEDLFRDTQKVWLTLSASF